MASGRHDAQFVDAHRAELIQRVTMVMPLADDLRAEGMLHEEGYTEVQTEKTSQNKMRRLFRALESGGDHMKAFFYSLLQKNEKNLLQDLEGNFGNYKKRRKLLPSSSKAQIKKKKKRERKRQVKKTGKTVMKYKERLCSEYDTFQEYNSLLGEQVPLDDRYTNLLIIQQHRKKEEKEEELRARGKEHHKVLSSRSSKDGSSTSIEQLFHPDDRGRIPKAVILQGDSGYGKSFTVQKIVYDWACGNLYQGQFELVLHLRCKELNLLSGKKNVVQLLNCSSEFIPMIKEKLTTSPEKVLFIIDGFDELKFSLEDNNRPSLSNAFTPASIEDTLRALLSGHILQTSSLLITTRSTASDKLTKLLCYPQRFTEILGFSESAVKEYFQRFFKDTQMSDEAYKHVTADIMLSTVCSIPVICWIVCTTFREQFEEGKGNIKGLEATTSIFLHFVSLLLQHHCQGLKNTAITLLRSLAKLAKRGILEKQVLFEMKWVLKVASDPTSVPFLCKFLVKKNTGVDTMFSFMHLSFQEFFTALHYIITDDKKAQRKLEKRLPYSYHTFTDNIDLLKKPDMYDSDFLAVIPFLFGLSNKEGTQLLLQKYNISVSPTLRSCLEEWIIRFIEDITELLSPSARFEDFILHCLYELHEEQFVQKAMDSWGKIDMSGYFISDMSCWTLKYCILCCSRVKGLYVWIKTMEQLRMLQPALHRCEELQLTLCDLKDADVDCLISALEERVTITELTISRSLLNEQSLRKIITSVSSQHSLRRISLSVKKMTSSAVATFLQFVQHREIGLAKLNSCDEDSSCISYSHLSNNTRSYRLTAGHHLSIFSMSVPSVEMAEHSQPEDSNFALSIKFADCTETSSADWIALLQTFHTLKHLTQSSSDNSSAELAVEMDGLLSSLRFTPHLTELTLEVTCLNINWAVWTLALHQNCPGLANIRVVEQICSNEYSVCSCLTVKKGRNKTASSDVYTLSFQIAGPRLSLDDSAQPLALSRITLTIPLSSKMSSFDWKDFLQELQLIRNTKIPVLDDHQDALLASLHRLPNLQKVGIHVHYLTETLAQGIISLIQTCLSIKQLEYRCNSITDPCRVQRSMVQRVVITIKGTAVEEDVSSCCSSTENEDRFQDFESDAEGSEWETQ